MNVAISRRKRALRSSHLASGVVASPWGVEREETEEGLGGRKLFDLAHFANLQKLFHPPSDAFTIRFFKAPLLYFTNSSPLGFVCLMILLLGQLRGVNPMSSQSYSYLHGASFAPHKYVLIHFPKKKRILPITPLELPTITLHPSPHARVLGLILDSKLSWHPHISHIKSKLRTQTFAVTRLTSSTWGALFSSCRLLYTSIVCPAITYASTA